MNKEIQLQLENSIMRVLTYFDLFDYPLYPDEILYFLDQPVNRQALYVSLDSLCSKKCIFKYREVFSVRDDEKLAARRMKGTMRALHLLNIARKNAGFLFRFPYIRGIAISGSLSKNFAAEDADIDFFIITKRNRLWIARTFMHLFKKLTFLYGGQHRYCMNYYIDEEGLEIPEKNLFTAIELITLLPVTGNGVIDRFFNKNNWAKIYYPNSQYRGQSQQQHVRPAWVKKILETVFNNRAGDWLDDFFMKWTTRRWKEKERLQKRSVKGTLMGLSTGKHFSKPNPVLFQEKILQKYTSRLNQVSARWSLLPD
jgi:hypothetical protein